jgi:urease accessory protein
MSGSAERLCTGTAVLAVAVLLCGEAGARTAVPGGPFANGLSEAYLVLDHLAAFLAAGLWAGQIGVAGAWRLPVAAVLAALAAGIAANLGLPLPYAGIGAALATLGIGGVVAAEWRPAPLIALPVAAVAGVFHGYMSGGVFLYWTGYGTGLLLVAAAGLGLSAILSQGIGAQAIRVCGAGAALVGILDLVQRF